ncbi:hypothetical protein C0V76_09035 [Uliginosibacterium sp. TH139]|nr:hypothetical protein C0V76_09035 [Uliginosibacterium sp. TH139]
MKISWRMERENLYLFLLCKKSCQRGFRSLAMRLSVKGFEIQRLVLLRCATRLCLKKCVFWKSRRIEKSSLG